jgi:hypothetical protein
VKADLLAREFEERNARPTDGRLLLQAADAIALIDRAAEEGVPIVRISGVAVAAHFVESSREHEVDFSPRVLEGHGCWQEADAFIRERSELGLAFELTLGDDPVEAV